MTKIRFNRRSGATAWLGVSIFAIVFMGVYAFLIALARTPVIGQLFTQQDFFFTALVTHVALALIIWFIAFIVFVMYYITAEAVTGKIDLLAALGALLGVIFIVITPFTGPANPTLNNYAPVLDRPLYFAGLFIFIFFAFLGASLRAKEVFRAKTEDGPYPLIIRGSLLMSGFSIFTALLCFGLAYQSLPGGVERGGMEAQLYFELLFWGGGHILQFANALGLMAVWSLLMWKLSGKAPVEDKTASGILSLMALFILSAPLQYAINDYDSMELRRYFTVLKGWGLSFGPIIIGLSMVISSKKIGQKKDGKRGLFASLILFALGGFIALTLSGSDTRVPAHYHGVIGGVTLAFMTLGIVAVTENGWLLAKEKWRVFQLTLYGVGQSFFVIGLFTAGLAGAPRKTFGAAQSLDGVLKYSGMTIMGIGGLLAVASGAMFVVFILRALYHSRNETQQKV